MNTDATTKPVGDEPSFVFESDVPVEYRTDLIPGTKIQYPSKAYESNCGSYAYRISELIFGSLLAAYILGFVSFAAKDDLLLTFQMLLISLTFCYLTASYYVTYHFTILTMPHIPQRALRFDFLIAIFQAVLFGISMLCTSAFLICLAFSLFSVFTRQLSACTLLAATFENASPDEVEGKSEWNMNFFKHRRFKEALLKVNGNLLYKSCLNGWLPITGTKWLVVSLMFVFGCCLVKVTDWLSLLQRVIHISDEVQSWVQIILYLIMFVLIWIFVNIAFKSRASHTYVYELPDYKKRMHMDFAAKEINKFLKNETKLK